MSGDTGERFAVPRTLSKKGFALRPEREEDIPFLSLLFYTTRSEEPQRFSNMSYEQRVAFLDSQFQLQRKHYYGHFPWCQYLVLEKDRAPVGRLYLDMAPKSLDVLDISLMPQSRGQGIGTALMEAVIDLARDTGRHVGLFVERFNPAFNLYRRLGFEEVADTGVYIEMHWKPQTAAA